MKLRLSHILDLSKKSFCSIKREQQSIYKKGTLLAERCATIVIGLHHKIKERFIFDLLRRE